MSSSESRAAEVWLGSSHLTPTRFAHCSLNYSFFLAFVGFIEILISVPMSFAIFAIIGNGYVSFLQFMGLFIIMGIGADDIFVFIDAYKQSLREDGEPVEKFKRCYARSATAMFVTSCTSGFAFFATAISPIPAVAAFGLTMGFMVFCDFFLVITWFPAGVLIYERYIGKVCCDKRFSMVLPNESEQKSPVAKLGKMETWFNETFMGWQSNNNVGRGLIAFFAVVMIVCFSTALSNLKVTGDLPANFDDNHPFTQFRTVSTGGKRQRVAKRRADNFSVLLRTTLIFLS